MLTSRRDFIAAGGALAALFTRAEAVSINDATCRRAMDGAIELSWKGEAADVLMASRVRDTFDTVLARSVRNYWKGPAPVLPRPYFQLKSRRGSVLVAERFLPLQGGRNFRDLGGYLAADGRMVRWGRIYRSGSMVGLTEWDYEYLSHLGVRVICDLRSTSERATEPTKWAGPQVLSRDYDIDMDRYRRDLGAQPTEESTRTAMVRNYERLPYEQAEMYAKILTELAAGRAPLTLNCSAGKDRTGLAAALILSALDVPRSTIFADYLLSNEARARTQGQVAAVYLKTAFATIEKNEGSVSAYFDQRLGLSAADIQRLREQYLQTVL